MSSVLKKPLDVGGRSKSRHSWRPAPSLGLRLCHGNLGSASGGLGRAGGGGPAPRSARGRRPRVARPDRCPGVRPRARVSSLRAPPGRPPRPCAPVPASRGGGCRPLAGGRSPWRYRQEKRSGPSSPTRSRPAPTERGGGPSGGPAPRQKRRRPRGPAAPSVPLGHAGGGSLRASPQSPEAGAAASPRPHRR